MSWKVTGFNGRPDRLVAVGVDMYAYRSGDGDAAVGALLLDIVRSAAQTVTTQ